MQRKEAKDYIKLLPIALILLIVPLIVYMKTINLDDVVAGYWTGSKQVVDFFSYYKMVWFIALTSIAILLFLYYVAAKKVKITFQKIIIPLAVYLVFVFLSSSFSKFHNQAFFGFPDRYEGLLTILSYIITCFFCSILISSNFDIKYLFSFLAVSVLVISIIGFTQFFGFDLLQTNLGRHMMLPKANYNLVNTLKFNFPENFIYSTLYNPNYVGSFFAMIFPICLIFFISSKNISQRVVSGLFCLLTFINIVGSLSSTGYIGAAVASIAIIIVMRKDLRRNFLPLLAIVICFCSITLIMNYTSHGALFGEFKSLSSTNQNVTNSKVTASNSSNDSNTPTKLIDIKIDKNILSLYVSETDALVLEYDTAKNELLFSDLTNKDVAMVTNTENDIYYLTFNDSKFKDIKLSVKNSLITVEAPNTAFNTIFTNEGFKFVSQSGQPTDIIKAKSFGFKGKELWGSSRGYIWSRSIPMIKDTLFIGYGPDTFAMYFPQNDYVAKLHYLSGITTVVDKPHNMYLQIAINTGLVSLIAFLIFVGWYCITCLRLYFNGIYNEYYTFGIACFIAVVAFLVSSLANDSTVSVSPVFWILLGIGIACNRLYSQKLLITNTTK